MFSALASLAPLALNLLGGMGGGQQQHQGYAHGGYADGGMADGGMNAMVPMPQQQPASYPSMNAPIPGTFAHGGYAQGGVPMQSHHMGNPHMMHAMQQHSVGHQLPMHHYGWGGLSGLLSSAWNAAKPMVSSMGRQALGQGANMLANHAGSAIGNMVGNKFGQGAGQMAQGLVNKGVGMGHNMVGNQMSRFGLAHGGVPQTHEMLPQMAMHPYHHNG